MLNIGRFARLGQVSPRMLRHYDGIGLLTPDRVDPQTGYRSYDVAQLGRLHRLLAMRDLGFTLEQIRPLLDEDVSVEELRGMLRMRQVQIEQHLLDEQARLRRVEAHLRAIEGNTTMQIQDIVIKWTDPVRVAEASAVAPGYGSENLGPIFAQVLPEVLEHLRSVGVTPGISIAYYEAPADDGSVVLHAGFDIGGQPVPESDRVRAISLPVVEVASIVHRGAMEGIAPTFEALIRWSEDSGFTWTDPTRELYHEWHEEDPALHVTELQLPIAGSDRL